MTSSGAFDPPYANLLLRAEGRREHRTIVVLRRLSEAEAAELIDLTRVLTEGDVP